MKMEYFNIISGVCSIIGLLVSIFVASKVIKITSNDNSKTKVKQSENKLGDNSIMSGRDTNVK
ncbi:hypothetical protein QYB82_000143 [Clostridium perfringens]|nr:hypothetical protein [Clostridium perfringens]